MPVSGGVAHEQPSRLKEAGAFEFDIDYVLLTQQDDVV